MQTNFTLAQLADPETATAEKILRSCVHCGFCTATCPTYVLLGDELDSPRGRIYLIKEMLEGDHAATKEVVTHVDRCLSCLSCMTTCPPGTGGRDPARAARVRAARSGALSPCGFDGAARQTAGTAPAPHPAVPSACRHARPGALVAAA
jgi:glycolate oxidase iron-sulfur subunit